MIARGARTVASLALAAAMGGCSTSYLEIPIETPIPAKLDVRPFSRVFVAGFITAGSEDVDGNLETVRLLRSQLRNKGALRVVDADALTLTDLVAQEPADAAGAAGNPPPQPPADANISDEAQFVAYEKVFADTAYWMKVGEELQQPLIITGTVLFRPQTRSGFVQTERETFDSLGRRHVEPQRQFMERKGFILRPSFVFIEDAPGRRYTRKRFGKRSCTTPARPPHRSPRFSS